MLEINITTNIAWNYLLWNLRKSINDFIRHKKGTGKQYYYYKCTRATKYGKGECYAKDLKADDLKNFVHKLVSHLGSDKELFEAVISQVKDHSSSEVMVKSEKLKEINFNLGRTTKDLNSYIS